MTVESQARQSICDRCSSDNSEYFWINCGKVYLCESCDDLIHSLGTYDTHKRILWSEVENSPIEPAKTFEVNPSNPSGNDLDVENIYPLTEQNINNLSNAKESLSKRISEGVEIMIEKLNGIFTNFIN